jgi:hypothetical protein
MENEFWKQMGGSLIRHAVVTVGGIIFGVLVTKGILTQEQADTLFNEAFITAIVGFLLVAGGIAWSYMKVKFNINFVKAAITAPQSATVAEVKEIALGRETTQTSV